MKRINKSRSPNLDQDQDQNPNPSKIRNHIQRVFLRKINSQIVIMVLLAIVIKVNNKWQIIKKLAIISSLYSTCLNSQPKK